MFLKTAIKNENLHVCFFGGAESSVKNFLLLKNLIFRDFQPSDGIRVAGFDLSGVARLALCPAVSGLKHPGLKLRYGFFCENIECYYSIVLKR